MAPLQIKGTLCMAHRGLCHPTEDPESGRVSLSVPAAAAALHPGLHRGRGENGRPLPTPPTTDLAC